MDICKKFYGQSLAYFDEKGCGYTAQEIAQQPLMWQNLCKILKQNEQAIKNFMTKLQPLNDIRIILTGAGSSGFVGSAVAGFVSQNTGINCEAIHTTDIVSAPDTYLSDTPTLLISFARSGNSPESTGAVEYARIKIKNLYEIAVTCDGTSKLSQITKQSDKSLILVMPEGSNDRGFAMTSSVSCMALAGFAVFNWDKIDELTADILRASNQIENSNLAEVAANCATWNFNRAWFLASGPLTALANEAALKMMELSYGAVVAGHNNSAEFRHGPKTVMRPETLTIHFISNNTFTARYDLDLLNELYAERNGNKVVALYDASNKQVQADVSIPYTSQEYGIGADIIVGLQCLVFVQLLAMYKSLNLGVTTDNPSPDGLVNRVVQGVTVYPYPLMP